MINILLCGNNKVFDGMLTELISITNRTNEPIRCIIFTAELTRIKKEYTPLGKEEADFLDNYVKTKNSESEVRLVDVTELYEEEFMKSPNESAYCTPYTLLRLLADLVEDIPDKLLYLDIDMMIDGDIAELYNIDIEDYEYAAVKEKYGCIFIRPDYINAGMLLLNLKKIKETRLLEKARVKIKTKRMQFADQDAVYWSTTKKKLLPRRYNEQSKFDRADTLVCHFCKRLMFRPYPHITNFKQWDIEKVHNEFKCHRFDDDLNKYLELKEEFKEQKVNGEQHKYTGIELEQKINKERDKLIYEYK